MTKRKFKPDPQAPTGFEAEMAHEISASNSKDLEISRLIQALERIADLPNKSKSHTVDDLAVLIAVSALAKTK